MGCKYSKTEFKSGNNDEVRRSNQINQYSTKNDGFKYQNNLVTPKKQFNSEVNEVILMSCYSPSHLPKRLSKFNVNKSAKSSNTHSGKQSDVTLSEVHDTYVENIEAKHKLDKSISTNPLGQSRVKKKANISDVYSFTSEILGIGSVKVIQHRKTKEFFALKTLSLEKVGSKREAMLRNEVAIYLKLDHPNIAKLIEVYESEKAIHLVMELCTGGELYDRLFKKKKYSEKDAVQIIRQMLSAINYCHQHQICHRDLKLENWVYANNSPDAALKLIDFGFSRIFNPNIPMTAMHGTIFYVSPEVIDGCYKEKCDMWSLGVILFMLLSGYPPFTGSNDREILLKIKKGHFEFSSHRWQGISFAAKSFIQALLEKDFDKRLSAKEALNHEWLKTSRLEDNDIDLEVVKSMQNFALGNVLRRAALGIVALEMTSFEVSQLESIFRKLDKSNRGTLQLSDIANVLIQKLNISDDEAQRIFHGLDLTGDNEIHYSEFIASTLQAKYLNKDSLIQKAFQRFDVENKGYITLSNLSSILGESYSGVKVENIFDLCDTSRDGVIDFSEVTSVSLHIKLSLNQFSNALTPDDSVSVHYNQNDSLQLSKNHSPPSTNIVPVYKGKDNLSAHSLPDSGANLHLVTPLV